LHHLSFFFGRTASPAAGIKNDIRVLHQWGQGTIKLPRVIVAKYSKNITFIVIKIEIFITIKVDSYLADSVT